MLLCVSRFRYSVGVGLVSWFVHEGVFLNIECCCGGVGFDVSCFRFVLRFGGWGVYDWEHDDDEAVDPRRGAFRDPSPLPSLVRV